MVEPVKTKLNAYHFDGKRESALEAVDKWDGVISMVDGNRYDNGGDNKSTDLYKFIFKSGTEVLPGNYIVIKDGIPNVYSQSEFITKYKIVYDVRDRLHPYMLLD
jgi:hypothetical protein